LISKRLIFLISRFFVSILTEHKCSFSLKTKKSAAAACYLGSIRITHLKGRLRE
jgi:hypothetical protein